MSASTSTQCGFVHAALLYHSEAEYVDEVVSFVRDGLAADQPVFVGLPADKLTLIRDALGDAAPDVTMADLGDVGRNPGRIIGLEALFAAEYPGRQLRMVGETTWPGRTADEYPACVQHEALVNSAFTGQSATGLCPFDASRLPEQAVSDALATHPQLWRGGKAQPNNRYAPEETLARYNQPLAGNTTGATYTVAELTDLSTARAFAGRYAGWVGMSPAGIADLKLIVTELATNSLQHAETPCQLAFWRQDSHLVCQARDAGRLDDPLAGRLPPDPGGPTGRGLFLVNALADLVRSHTTDGGTTIRAQLRLVPDEAS